MNPERWKKIRNLFEEASALEPGDRDRFLERECAGDEKLRRSVKKLLAAQEESDGFIDPSEGRRISKTIETRLMERALGTRVGGYEIRRIIASGGMGTVYEALQRNPQRVVALKMMRRGLASASVLRRFQYESELLAKLRHPGIAQIFEAGTHVEEEGRDRREVPFFAMEFIEDAHDILEYVKKKGLSLRDRLALFSAACEGVHHGHQRGVIHRDLKPANILVDASGQTKIIDFGVARAVDAEATGGTLLTETGQVMGTLQYMSPEQLGGEAQEVDTRSDIYALGVLLYELLTDQVPYDVYRRPIHEAARIISEEPPCKPSERVSALHGDLEWIILKAMEKDRERRYESVAGLAADIRRYLENQPVLAGPPSAVYRLRKFFQRHRVSVVAGAAVAVSLVAATVLSSLAMMRANESNAQMKVAYEEKETQRKLAEEESERARQEADRVRSAMAFIQGIISESEPGRGGSKIRVLEALEEAKGHLNRLFKGKPRLEADVRAMLGSIYLMHGHYEESTKQLEQAIDLRRGCGLEDDVETLAMMTDLAENLLQLERLSGARELCERTLEMKTEVLGPDDKSTLLTAILLGRILRTKERFEESESVLRGVLERAEGVFGSEHLVTWKAQHSLALTLQKLGKYEESEKYTLQALEVKQRKLGMDNPDTVLSLANLGQYYQTRGRWKEAGPVIQKAYDLGKLIWEKEHPTLLAIAHNLAVSKRWNKKPEEAAELYRDIIEPMKEQLGPTNRYVLLACQNYATLLVEDLKRYEEAERICRDTVEKMRDSETLGPEHEYTLSATNTLGTILQDSGRLAEAEKVLEEVTAIAWRVLPAHDWQPGWFQGNYAGCLVKQKRYAEAEEAYLKGYERMVPILGFKHPRTVTLINGIHQLYKLWEKPEKAKALQDRMKKDNTAGS